MPRLPKLFGKGGRSAPIRIERPLLIVFQDEAGNLVTRIHPPDGFGHVHYGILICDLVRHVARMMKVEEDEIWKWVDKERDRPTSEIRNPS